MTGLNVPWYVAKEKSLGQQSAREVVVTCLTLKNVVQVQPQKAILVKKIHALVSYFHPHIFIEY